MTQNQRLHMQELDRGFAQSSFQLQFVSELMRAAIYSARLHCTDKAGGDAGLSACTTPSMDRSMEFSQFSRLL